MKWKQSTWDRQFGGEYGEPITLATVAAITSIVAAVGGTGLSVGLALKQAADQRQAVRIETLKRKRKAIKRRAQMVAQRRQEADAQIESSKQMIAAAQTKAQDRTPWILYAGAAGLVLVSFIAAKAARRG
jgi:hypothetical protein|tara:strand:- start:613 stop:1002 length:390 start_codon:yes stop_codon:yes gene_type:complete